MTDDGAVNSNKYMARLRLNKVIFACLSGIFIDFCKVKTRKQE